ncbi:MAG: hypothetical protein NTY38_27850 [Acidobacteria bacterium]|nr:hypothetical protein [Acidobacteriota bacterium]
MVKRSGRATHKRFYDRVVELLERDTAVRFTVETLWQLEQYLARSKPDEIARFFRLVRAGRIEVCAGYDNPNTSAMAYEELGRLFYQAAAIRRKYGIPIETLIFNDQPGYTWGLADIAAASGVRYFLTGINLFDGQSIPGNLFPMTHRPFYWVGRTGDRLLTWPSIGEQERGVRPWDAAAYRCTGCAAYTTADRNLGLVLIEPAAAPPGLDKARWDRENLKARVLKGLAFYADRDYPYPHLLMMAANGDNNSGTKWGHGENFELFEWMTAAVRHLNASEKNLRAVITTPSVFFRLMEREYGHFAALPAPGAAHGGDWPSTWEELDGAAPLSSARIRRARELLVTAEKLAATNTAAGSAAAYPARDFDDAWRLIRLWDEHTSPQFPAPLPFEEIWQHASEHAQFALDSLVIAERLSRQSLSRLAASLAGRRAPRILVFNQTAWARTGLAGCDRPSAGAFRLIDPATGTPVPWQPSVSQPDRILFVAGSVPANGYKVYEVVPGPPGESSKAGPLQVDAGRR